ncbi:MAG TPA: BON domain-containing protein [Anaerolineales bacterium]|nr:BON domain-containing protein [Anaerolineales bacterium]
MTSPTDDHLRAAVLRALSTEPQTEGLNLRIGVLNGVVHIGGDVASGETRALAETICGQVAGVRGVVNRIQAPGAPIPSRTIHVDLSNDKGRGQ